MILLTAHAGWWRVNFLSACAGKSLLWKNEFTRARTHPPVQTLLTLKTISSHFANHSSNRLDKNSSGDVSSQWLSLLTSLVVRGKEAFGGRDIKQKRKDELFTDSGFHRRDAWELFSTTLKQKRVLKKMGEGFRLAASQRDFSFGFCHSTSSPSRPDSDNGNQFTNSPYKWFV